MNGYMIVSEVLVLQEGVISRKIASKVGKIKAIRKSNIAAKKLRNKIKGRVPVSVIDANGQKISVVSGHYAKRDRDAVRNVLKSLGTSIA